PILDYQDISRYTTLENGFLSDGERDADNDGLTNVDECCYRMTQEFWEKKYDGSNGFAKETPYAVIEGGASVEPVTYPTVSPTNPDTDGDGVSDGMDDQDHDGLTNRFEVSRPWD